MPAEENRQACVAKCAVACEYCRAKRIKCNAQQPCQSCLRHGKGDLCRFPPPPVRRQKNAREKHRILHDRLQRAEALLQVAGLSIDQVTPSDDDSHHPGAVTGGEWQTQTQTQTQTETETQTHDLSPLPPQLGGDGQAEVAADDTLPQRAKAAASGLHQIQKQPPRSPPSVTTPTTRWDPLPLNIGNSHEQDPPQGNHVQNFAAVDPHSSERVEFQGSGSFLSICSPAGVKWVTNRIGSSNFMSGATYLASFIARSLKLQKSSHVELMPEPDEVNAWKFVQTFFDESFDATMNVIHRPTFEARLHNHLEQPEEISADPSWYALRNIVYAFGARVSIYNDSPTKNWQEAQTYGWRYFQNAFSVHSDLLYSSSTIAAVQALFAMALYVEGTGSPKLEYILISNALRIAQSKGLADRPSPSWKLSTIEAEKRNWLFWSIYIYEKHISFRSRRPSAIDDDDIDCPLPSCSLDGFPHKAVLLRHLVSHAQITSRLVKELFSNKSRRQPLSIISNKVKELDALLQSWRRNLPEYLQLDIPFTSFGLPPGIRTEHKLMVHLSYYGTLSAIHIVLNCPWNIPGPETEISPAIRKQVELSTEIVAEASRNSILLSRCINLDAATPICLSFIFPFVATLNLFTHILQFPALPSTQSDISLLDMMAGYFSYLEFTTMSYISISFPRDMTQWARAAASRSCEGLTHPEIMDSPPLSIPGDMSTNIQSLEEIMNGTEFGLDDWSSFFSTV